jgi:hypothetical protein
MRSPSDAARNYYGQLTLRQRRNVTAAARRSPDSGWPHRESILLKAAKTRERNQSMIAPGERTIIRAMKRRSMLHGGATQKAAGKYNIDYAIGSVAVEIVASISTMRSHRAGAFTKRMKDLGDLGWHVYVIRLLRGITDVALDDLGAFVEKASRNKSAPRQYRVIRSDGKAISRGHLDDDDIALVIPHRGRCDASCRHLLIAR